MKLYWEAFIRLVYPANCGVCRTLLELEEEGICQSCRVRLTAIRFSPETAILDADFKALDEGWTLYPYESPARDLLMNIKFSKKRWLMRVFEEEIKTLALALTAQTHYDYLVPIPLDRHKLLDREFNQSELISGFISKWTGIPAKPAVLRKHLKTPTQSQLSRRERQMNLKQAFRVSNANQVSGKNILLVDDVLTTGATAEEAARMLKTHGAQRVDIFALARTEIR